MKQKLVYLHDQYYKDETGSLDYYKKALYFWVIFLPKETWISIHLLYFILGFYLCGFPMFQFCQYVAFDISLFSNFIQYTQRSRSHSNQT